MSEYNPPCRDGMNESIPLCFFHPRIFRREILLKNLCLPSPLNFIQFLRGEFPP